jgi:hypothetical protein
LGARPASFPDGQRGDNLQGGHQPADLVLKLRYPPALLFNRCVAGSELGTVPTPDIVPLVTPGGVDLRCGAPRCRPSDLAPGFVQGAAGSHKLVS